MLNWTGFSGLRTYNQTLQNDLRTLDRYLEALSERVAQLFGDEPLSDATNTGSGSSTDVVVTRHAWTHADGGGDPITPYNFTWTGIHIFTPSTNAVGVTIRQSAAQTTANLFEIEHPSTANYFEVDKEGLVGLNSDPDAHLVVQSTGIDPMSFGGGPFAWFKADAITTGVDGSRLAQWDDSSGNGRHAAGAVGFGPEYLASDPGLNNKPALLFAQSTGWYNTVKPTNGSSRYRSIVGGPHSLNDFTIFVVQRPFSPNDYYDGLFLGNEGGSIGPTNDNRMTTRTSTRSEVYLQDNAGNYSWGGTPPFVPPPIPASGDPIMACFRRNGSDVRYRHNGTEFNSSAPVYLSGGVVSTAFKWMSIGGIADNGGIAHWGNKVIAEIIIYNSYLSDTDVLAVENYLNSKYNINGGGSGSTTSYELQRWKNTLGVIRARVDESARFGIIADPAARLHVQADSASEIPLIVQGATAQTAALTEWLSSTSTVLSRISAGGLLGIGVDPTAAIHIRTTVQPQIQIEYDSTHYGTIGVDLAGNYLLRVNGAGGTGNIFNLRDSVARAASQIVFLLDSDDAAQSSPHYMKANNLGNFSFGYGNSGSVIDPIPGHVLSFLQQTHNRPSFSTQINDCGILAYVQYDDTTGTGTSVNGAACGVKSVVGLTSSLAGVPFAPIGVIGHFGYASCNFDDPSLGGHSLASFHGYFGGTIGSLDYQTRAPIDDVNTNGAIRGAFDHVSVFWANARTYGAGGTNPTNKPVISSSARIPIQGCATDEQWGVYGHSFNFTGTKQLCTTSGFIRIPFPGTNGATNRAHAYWLPTAAPAGGSVWVNAGGEYWDDGTNCAAGSYEYNGTSWFRRRTTYFTQTNTPTAIANTTTETTLVGTGVGSVVLPAKLFVIGRTVRVVLKGYYGTDVAAPTLRFKVKLIDSTPTTVTILDTGAVTMTASQTNQYYEIAALITCRTTGATGTVMAQGYVTAANGATTALLEEMSAGGTANANTATSTIDTTKTEQVEITATWGTANNNNTLTSTNMTVEVLN